ncbi:DNA replication complex GINS protein PSF2 [Zancudomyces culisetae]|uniref:DNA replication complex GINS protein PSF2 n=1 Tax=Zancudomyces culisetae TaxID=1213189 RepID=A0A1R1PSP7_ZANCU|nr:DNA replication complex GINS protein PSF2 [Zancudomyces culisetae]|eukprot:OMH84016.1 DNA replication complex GINS protein PSF2 [Zancudomyces culisetae]
MPLFNKEKLELITGTIGPFNPLKQIEVPLWLAIQLKKLDLCRFVIPQWLTAENLEHIYIAEKTQGWHSQSCMRTSSTVSYFAGIVSLDTIELFRTRTQPFSWIMGIPKQHYLEYHKRKLPKK